MSYDPATAGYSDDFLQQLPDPQTGSTTSYLESLSPAERLAIRVASDPSSSASLYRHAVGKEIRTGLVLFSLPYQHHYKVQVHGGPLTKAIFLSPTGLLPYGAKSSTVIPPGSNVLLIWPETSPVPYIIGVTPYQIADDKKSIAEITQQGGNSGVIKQKGYRELTSKLIIDGQIQNYGCGRPMDGDGFAHVITSSNGSSFLLDEYQIALSINEGCGLFLNWFDNHTRLSGFGLDIQSYAEHVMQRYDEGENISVKGSLIYPWESTGAYKDGQDFTKEYAAKEYQVREDKPYGHIDLPEDKNDLVPIYRLMEYGGYLGQGVTRMLMKPAKEDGFRYEKDTDVDYGLWHETVALDGSYTMRSAKSVFIGKYALIPVPKRVKLAETQDGGDDAREDNYKFSGKFGGGDPHKVKDFTVTGENANLLRAAGVLDLLAYNYNWKGTHPFYYHEKDYYFPQESELSKIEKTVDSGKLTYDSLSGNNYLEQPTSKKLKIDDRYGDVEYFQSLSYLTMLDDGGVLIGDGYGAQITMTGGQLRLEAPGEIVIMPGTKAVTLCHEFIVRAKNNVELSSSKKDVRLKAEGNMQLLSGNGGMGGMLIENKADYGKQHVYEGMYGDEVQDTGITLLTKKAEIGLLSKDVYIRSDTEGGSDGKLVLDGGQGKSNIEMYAQAMHIFERDGVTLWEGPQGSLPQEMQKTHRFHSSGSMHSSKMTIEGDIITTKGGSVVCAGQILSKGNILTRGKLGHWGSVFVGDLSKASTDIGGAIDEIVKAAQEGLDKMVELGAPTFDMAFMQLYLDGNLGNNEWVTNTLGFSFNDKPSGNSYGYGKFTLPETRWQQWTNLGLASGGSAWTETSVIYQGLESYPWPGKKHWKGSNYKQLSTLNLFDTGSGKAADRGGDYEDPQLESFTTTVPDGTYKLIGE